MDQQNRILQPTDLLSLLCCPACRCRIELCEGGYCCCGCLKRFPVVRNVLRFVDSDDYADNFGYQWQTFSTTQLRPGFTERNFQRKTGLREEDLRGKLVLDAGCGMGRFADVATRWGAKVVGVDLSRAAEVAASNLAGRDFVALQASLFALPFAPGSFDCIYSVGVLHHTPDCELAFKTLAQYLKPGGYIAVWLYSGYNNWYRFSDMYRRFTPRVPAPKLHAFLKVAVPFFYWLDRSLQLIPLVGKSAAGVVQHVFPVNRHPDPQIRVLDTLDWYSAKYQSKHTYEQVFRWFESCGLENLTVGDKPVAVKAQRPASGKTKELPEPLSHEGDATGVGSSPVPIRTTTSSSRNGDFSVTKKAARSMRWVPSYAWQRVTRRGRRSHTHLIIALADHFEPAIVPWNGFARAPYEKQERRLERWCREYPSAVDAWRDADGHPFVHTYFYPAEQYDKGLVGRLAHHCNAGWGEIEVHLHHGVGVPDTEENTRRQLVDFRDVLATEHGGLCYLDGASTPCYAFVHGNFALANSAAGRNCGVDSEMQVLAETGCYADFTLPPGLYHRAHIPKINSLYECELPLNRRGAHRQGRSLEAGRPPRVLPLMVEGPLMLSFVRPDGSRAVRVENGSLTSTNPPSMYRLGLWKKAGIRVKGRPEWLFIKLQCHGMDPRDRDVMLGAPFQQFLRELTEGAPDRSETIHFVSAREMVNIIFAACDGRGGSPGDYRDYRLTRVGAAQNVPKILQTSF